MKRFQVTDDEMGRIARAARTTPAVAMAVTCGEPGPSDLERGRVVEALVAHGLLRPGQAPAGVRAGASAAIGGFEFDGGTSW